MDSFDHYFGELLSSIQRLPLQYDSLELACRALADADQIVCVGVGKSGFVAQKLNASLSSLSLNCMFLHPSEAMHGDVGVVQDGAVVIVFSKSGNSSEINELLPYLKKRSCHIISVGNRVDSVLGSFSNLFLDIAVRNEGEPLNILPLISVDLSMILANMMVARISCIRGLTVEDFAKNHPGGQLGRNVSLSLADLSEWKERRPFVSSKTSIIDAVVIDSEFRAGMVCVVDDLNRLLGVVTDGDIRRAIRDKRELETESVDAIMNSKPIVLQDELLVGDALSMMESGERKVFSAPVLDVSGCCVGTVTLHDLIGRSKS